LIDINSIKPTAGFRLSQFPTGVAPVQGDTLVRTATGVSYTVAEPRPDSHGNVRLILNET
jgi:hypothetical protein